MSKFERVKYYYDNDLWDIQRVRNAVVKKWIIPKEFEIITAVLYGEE